MIRLLTIIGTRPELIKLSLVIKECDRAFEHVLAHTGQNYDYELNKIFFDEMEIRKPDYFLNCNGESTGDVIGKVVSKSYELMDRIKPDALLIYGDTNSGLSVISAKKLKIPVFHMEAGNRCFDDNVPEEVNRRLIDHLSDINIVMSDCARYNLICEGIKPNRIIRVGSCMPEICTYYKTKIETNDIVSKLGLKPKEYMVASLHREENVDNEERLLSICKNFNQLGLNEEIVFSVHPRTRARIKRMNIFFNENIKLLKPLGLFSYLRLQQDSKAVLSDSGTLTEEVSALGFVGIGLRQTHERQEGMDAGLVTMITPWCDDFIERVNMTVDLASYSTEKRKVFDYTNDKMSLHVVRIIISYVDYINRYTWRKLGV